MQQGEPGVASTAGVEGSGNQCSRQLAASRDGASQQRQLLQAGPVHSPAQDALGVRSRLSGLAVDSHRQVLQPRGCLQQVQQHHAPQASQPGPVGQGCASCCCGIPIQPNKGVQPAEVGQRCRRALHPWHAGQELRQQAARRRAFLNVLDWMQTWPPAGTASQKRWCWECMLLANRTMCVMPPGGQSVVRAEVAHQQQAWITQGKGMLQSYASVWHQHIASGNRQAGSLAGRQAGR